MKMSPRQYFIILNKHSLSYLLADLLILIFLLYFLEVLSFLEVHSMELSLKFNKNRQYFAFLLYIIYLLTIFLMRDTF